MPWFPSFPFKLFRQGVLRAESVDPRPRQPAAITTVGVRTAWTSMRLPSALPTARLGAQGCGSFVALLLIDHSVGYRNCTPPTGVASGGSANVVRAIVGFYRR